MLGFREPSYVFRAKNVLAQHQNSLQHVLEYQTPTGPLLQQDGPGQRLEYLVDDVVIHHIRTYLGQAV